MSGTSTDVSVDSTRTVTLSERDRHHVLTAKRRRLTIGFLAGTSSTVDLAELATAIVERDDEVNESDVEIERATVELHHKHLPKMDEMGLIHYDPRTRVVAPKKPAIDAVLSTDDG